MDGSGSGVLLAGGYVVTNAHVVWPFRSARLAFPNGEEFADVPVLNLDHMADLAVLGPITTTIPPIPLTSGEHLTVGDVAYLIGYPGEADRFPQPALARGIVSRMREWPSQAITYFQSDAAVAGGQSGGMLVSEQGEVIGISGFSFAEGNFALVASAADLKPRVDRLIAGEDVDGLTVRDLLAEGKRTRASYRPEHYYDQRVYVIREDPGQLIRVSAESELPFFLAVVDPMGELPILEQYEEGEGTGNLEGEFTVDYSAPYFIVVGPGAEPEKQRISVSANRRFLEYADPDDGVVLESGLTVSGQIEFGGDLDTFRMALEKGQEVTVTVDSIEIDPHLTVDYPGAWEGDVLYDDDSGGGLFSLNAQTTFVAQEDANYLFVVEDTSGYEFGGYQITVEVADE